MVILLACFTVIQYNGRMKRILFSLMPVVLFLVQPVAPAVTLWSDGVNEQGGWYDFNKSRDGSDSELCWALTASNLIAWWQDRRKEQVPQGVPTGAAVWRTFREAFNNDGSDPDEAVSWWFSGKYAPNQSPTGETNARILRPDAGAYYERDFSAELMYRNRAPRVTAADIARAFAEGFSRGDAFWIGVSFLKPNGQRYTHALTVWGVDCSRSATGEIRLEALYMADSDDRMHMLHRIPLRVVDGLLLFDCGKHPIYGRIGDITVNNYTGFRVHP